MREKAEVSRGIRETAVEGSDSDRSQVREPWLQIRAQHRKPGMGRKREGGAGRWFSTSGACCAVVRA